MGFALPVKGAAAFATDKADCLWVENAPSKAIEDAALRLQSPRQNIYNTPKRPGNATAACDPQSRFKNGLEAYSQHGWLEVGFAEIAVVLQARFWITSGWPTIQTFNPIATRIAKLVNLLPR
jgi:hypothetical protein